MKKKRKETWLVIRVSLTLMEDTTWKTRLVDSCETDVIFSITSLLCIYSESFKKILRTGPRKGIPPEMKTKVFLFQKLNKLFSCDIGGKTLRDFHLVIVIRF